jgi:predicted helicase
MKSGEEYEKIAHEVVQALHSDKKVTHNVKLLGRLTEVKRQIDVKLDENRYDFVMYECKDWVKSIGVGVVGQLLTDLEDVGAKKGAIIANSPFTKGAINLAAKKGVDLLHLVKTDNPKARVGIAALVLVRENVIDKIASHDA